MKAAKNIAKAIPLTLLMTLRIFRKSKKMQGLDELRSS
jgi:hypothetical protein